MVPEGYVEYKRRVLQRRQMLSATRVKPANRRFTSVREDTAKMQLILPLHYLAITPLAHRKRLFNRSTLNGKGLIQIYLSFIENAENPPSRKLLLQRMFLKHPLMSDLLVPKLIGVYGSGEGGVCCFSDRSMRSSRRLRSFSNCSSVI
jgi:hypothetical protein